jgi:hypothetical protein
VGEKEDGKILTAPLTLSLSRWWREGTCKSKVRDRGILKTCVRGLKGLYLFMEGH